MLFHFFGDRLYRLWILSKSNTAFFDVRAGNIDFQHIHTLFLSQTFHNLQIICRSLSTDINDHLSIIAFQKRQISLAENINARILQSDGIEHTTAHFRHTRCRIARPRHICHALCHDRTQTVQIYELTIFGSGSKGS